MVGDVPVLVEGSVLVAVTVKEVFADVGTVSVVVATPLVFVAAVTGLNEPGVTDFVKVTSRPDVVTALPY